MTEPERPPTLIERLERATGPDRDLDLAILNTLDAPRVWLWVVVGKTVTWHKKGPNSGFNPIHELDPVTASLDAIVKMIPAGWVRDVDATDPEDGIVVRLHENDKLRPPVTVIGTHTSEPIATAIAILKTKLPPDPLFATAITQTAEYRQEQREQTAEMRKALDDNSAIVGLGGFRVGIDNETLGVEVLPLGIVVDTALLVGSTEVDPVLATAALELDQSVEDRLIAMLMDAKNWTREDALAYLHRKTASEDVL